MGNNAAEEINMEIIERTSSSIEIQGNIVTKIFKEPILHINENWFDVYNNYYTIYKCVPAIYEASSNKIVMEYVEGSVNLFSKYSYDEVFNYITEMQYILTSFFEFSSSTGIYFYHEDIIPQNFVLTSKNKLILIDPESFYIGSYFNYHSILQANSKLSELLWRSQIKDQKYILKNESKPYVEK